MTDTPKRVQYKNWCFTSFNMDIDWEHLLIEDIDKKKSIKYLVYQGEYTKDNKKHIQGFVQFIGKKDMTYIKKLFQDNTLHLEPMSKNSTPEQASQYCKKTEKDGNKQETFFNFIEYGQLDNTVSGTRTDLIDLRQQILEGNTINSIMMTTTDNKTLHNCIQYNRPLRELQHYVSQTIQRKTLLEQYDDIIWNDKQKIIKDIIDTEEDCRRVNWIYDEIGNIGKTQLAKYYLAKGDTYYITGGKQNDILYSYEGQSVIIYDLARTYSDNLDHIYTTIENFKNGCYLSTKYITQQRVYSKQPTIVILANFKPDTSKLSKDRWNIIDLNANDIIEDESGKHFEVDVPNDNEIIALPIKQPKHKTETLENYIKRTKQDNNTIQKQYPQAPIYSQYLQSQPRYTYNRFTTKYWDRYTQEWIENIP